MEIRKGRFKRAKAIFTQFHQENQDRLPIVCVYRPTTEDFPGEWVARVHFTLPQSVPTNLLVTGKTLKEVRGAIPDDLHHLHRSPTDPDIIEEVWL